MRKFFAAFIIIAVVLVFFVGCSNTSEYNTELVVNGGFEEDYSGWTKNNGDNTYYSLVSTNPDADDYDEDFGTRQIQMETGISSNWMYLTQTVSVERGATYMLKTSINVADDIESDGTSSSYVGAFVGFGEDSGIKRINVLDSTDGWQTYTVYFTPVNNNELTLQVGIGTSVSKADGSARFDNVSLQKVESGSVVGYEIYEVGTTSALDRTTTGGIVYVVVLSVLAVLICYIAYVLIRRLMFKYPDQASAEIKLSRDKKFDFGAFFKSPAFLMTMVLLVAFAIRLVIVTTVEGQVENMNTLSNWATGLLSNNPWNFYEKYDTNFMPGTMYIMWFMGAMAKLLSLPGTDGMLIFLRIPAIIADIIAVYVIFNVASKHYNHFIGTVFAGLYAMLPVIFTNSATWGATESIYSLFLLLAFISILDKKNIAVIIHYSIAVFIRAEALVLLPLVAAYLIYAFVKNREARTGMIIAGVSAFVGMIAISLPFTVTLGGANPIFYIFVKFYDTAIANPYFSSNAFNFYGVFGLNMTPVTSLASVLSWLIYIIIAFYATFIFFFKKNRAELLLLASFILAAVYVFTTNSTPQTMFAAFALMLAYIAISGEKRVLLLLTIFSFTVFFNMAQLLSQSGYIGSGANAILISYADNDVFMIIWGIINILSVLYFAIVVYDVCYSDAVKELEPMNKNYFKTVAEFFKGIGNIIAGGKSK